MILACFRICREGKKRSREFMARRGGRVKRCANKTTKEMDWNKTSEMIE